MTTFIGKTMFSISLTPWTTMSSKAPNISECSSLNFLASSNLPNLFSAGITDNSIVMQRLCKSPALTGLDLLVKEYVGLSGMEGVANDCRGGIQGSLWGPLALWLV